MANQHWKRRINALISLSSRQHAVSLISIWYGNDLGTTGSQVDHRSVTILNDTERPVNVYISVSWSKVNTDKDLDGPANPMDKGMCLYNTSWSKRKQDNRLKFAGGGSKPEPPAAVNGYLLTTSMWNLPLFPVFRDGMWNFLKVSFFVLSEHSQLISWIVCGVSGTGELQAQTAGYLSACEPVEGVCRALPELLTHLTHCSQVIRHGCAPPVRLECELIRLALAEVYFILFGAFNVSALSTVGWSHLYASVSTLGQTKSLSLLLIIISILFFLVEKGELEQWQANKESKQIKKTDHML